MKFLVVVLVFLSSLADGFVLLSMSSSCQQQHRHQHRVSSSSRGAFLRQGAVAAVGCAFVGGGRPFAANAEDDLKNSISYEKFQQLLVQKKVVRARFSSPGLERCFVTIEGGQGEVEIVEGYPKVTPVSDESPARVLAQLRNAGIPYNALGQIDLSQYRKNKPVRSEETDAAEARQVAEDSEVDRRMSEYNMQ
jgi:hypothetical protein